MLHRPPPPLPAGRCVLQQPGPAVVETHGAGGCVLLQGVTIIMASVVDVIADIIGQHVRYPRENPAKTMMCKPKWVTVKSGWFVDRLKWGNDNQECSVGGGGGENENTLSLAHDEYITEVFGRKGAVLDAIGFRTNKGRTFGEFGGGGGHAFRFTAPAGKKLVGLTVRPGLFFLFEVVASVEPVWG